MKKYLALLLALIMTASLLAGCGEQTAPEAPKLTTLEREAKIEHILTATINGETVNFDKAPYLYFLQGQRDYNYAYMMAMVSYLGTDAPKWEELLESTMFTAPEKLSEAIVSAAQKQYLNYLFVEQSFKDLGLTLSAEEEKMVDKLIQTDWVNVYGHDRFNTIRHALGLTYDEFRSVVACNVKLEKLIQYYYGEGGPEEVTKSQKKEYFDNYYARFKYIVLSTRDEDGNKYGEAKLNEVYAKRDEALAELDGGASFEDVLVKYSQDYNDLSDETLTVSQKKAYEERNQMMVEDGLVTSDKGVFDQELAALYNLTVDEAVVSKVFSMKNGDVQTVTTDTALWIVKRYDANEKESYFTNVEDLVFMALYAEDFEKKYEDWKKSISYTFNLEALEVYAPVNLSDLFDFAGTSASSSAASK